MNTWFSLLRTEMMLLKLLGWGPGVIEYVTEL